MYSHQAISPVIGARFQAAIRHRTGSQVARGRPVRLLNPVAGLMAFLGEVQRCSPIPAFRVGGVFQR